MVNALIYKIIIYQKRKKIKRLEHRRKMATFMDNIKAKPAADGESPSRLEMREYRWLCPAFDFGEHGRERPVAECDVIERETVFPFFLGGVQGHLPP